MISSDSSSVLELDWFCGILSAATQNMRISVMTYNIHSCIGVDGQVSPMRIAEVISEYAPDMVALQEVDNEIARTGMVNQVAVIGEALGMSYHFHPNTPFNGGHFGNALLSRHSLRIVKTGLFPRYQCRRELERRGAILAEVEIEARCIRVLNTHLGLRRMERKAQVEKLLGHEWVGLTNRSFPVILCGDFNAHPLSMVCRLLKRQFRDVQGCLRRQRSRKTWHSNYPIVRIDHVFVSPDFTVRDVLVPRTARTRIASDHLPVIAHLEIC